MNQVLAAVLTIAALTAAGQTAWAQESLQPQAKAAQTQKTFTTVKELPITSVKNQWRSGTCWAFGTLGYFESEILRQTGKAYDLCEMFVVNRNYTDNATHYVRMHGDSVRAVIERYVGRCPETFAYEGKTYTPKSFAEELGLNFDDYVSLTSFTHHPFNQWFVIEAPYKWRLKPSYNIPIRELMDAIDHALDAGYTVAWGGDVSGGLTASGLAELPDTVQPSQQLRQEQWDDWRFTYDHVMLIYGKATDQQGKPYYMVKNTWDSVGPYGGIWYMSRDYMTLNTTYLFLNRNALPKRLRKAMLNNK